MLSQVQRPSRYGALGRDDEHALQPLEAFEPGPPGAPGGQRGNQLEREVVGGGGVGEEQRGPFFPPQKQLPQNTKVHRTHIHTPANITHEAQSASLLSFTLPHARMPFVAGAQPFVLRVSAAAEALMDAHAHLSSDEVVGLLAGSYDAASRTLRCGIPLFFLPFMFLLQPLPPCLSVVSLTGRWRGCCSIDTTFNATDARHKNIRANTNTYICPPSLPPPPTHPKHLILATACCARAPCASWPRRTGR